MTATALANAPLAERLRPKLLAEGLPLRIAFESGQPQSCILWGPPGTGKTTIARLMADAFDAQFITISAVLGGEEDPGCPTSHWLTAGFRVAADTHGHGGAKMTPALLNCGFYRFRISNDHRTA